MENLVGKKFGRLTVLRFVDKNQWGNYRWLCRCGCGKEKIILGYNLIRGSTKSCGCLHTKHGNAKNNDKTKTYRSWQNMIQRCINPEHKYYKHYGGRGIKVCKRWLKFPNFLKDMDEHPGKGYSIDRINNNGNYCKSNCRWATRKEQARNKRNNHLETYNGKTQCLIEWSEEYNINYKTLCSRIFKYGWSIKKALTTPVRKKNE